MKVSYYPGCSLEGTAKAYDGSARHVCRELSLELEDVPDWICCGSSPALKFDRMLSLSLSSQVLALSEKQGMDTMVVPCPFCFRRLASAKEEIIRNEDQRDRVRETIEADVTGDIRIENLLGYLRNNIGLDAIGAHISKPLKGLKVVPYYGCYLVKPGNVTHFDDPEIPMTMDEILTALGATVLDWDFKTECCGAGLALCKPEKVRELCNRIIDEAVYKGADAVVVACQLCQSNLDMRQKPEKKKKLPIVYFTQAMGLAFGLPFEDLGLKHHLVNPLPMLRNKGMIP